MTYWHKNPSAYRIFFLILLIVLTSIVFMNFYRTSTSITTGIYYGQHPSRFMVSEDIAGIKVNSDSLGIVNWQPDTIQSGELILSINEKEFKTPADFLHYFLALHDTSIVNLKIFNNKTVKFEEFVIKKQKLSDNFFDFLYDGFYINNVVTGSAADRAGIKAGDMLMAINGRTCSVNDNEALKYLRKQKPGQVIPYQILRDGKIRDFHLKLANFGIQFEFILLFVIGLIFIAMSVFFGLKGYKLGQARITALMFLFIGVYLAITPNLNPHNFDWFAVLRYFVHHITIIFAFPLIFHSLSYFPKEIPDFVNRPWTYLFGYVLSVIVLILTVVFYLTETNHYLNFVFPIAIVTICIFRLILRLLYRKSFTNEIKKIRRKITISYLLNLILLFVIAPIIGFSGIVEYDPALFKITEYFIILAIILPVAYLYTTFRYRLLDVEFKIKRNLQYILINTFTRIVFYALLIFTIYKIANLDLFFPNIHFSGTSLEFFDHGLSQEVNDFYEKVVFIIMSVVIAFLYWNFWNYVKDFIDKKFYRGKFDYKHATSELSDMIDKQIDKEELADSLTLKLGELVKLKRIATIFFKNEEKVWQQSFYGFDKEALSNFCSECNTMLIESVKQFRGGFGVDYLPENMKKFLNLQKIQYIIPIRSKRKNLGVFLIGEKLSEAPINNEDIEYLSSIAGHAAVAIENALLYEDLATQERMKHELELARKIQLAQLPSKVPDVDGLDISGICIPAMDVGGDFYDYLNGSNDSITIVIGDVSGKGTSAALYMSKVQGIIRTLYEFDLAPRQLLIRTNQLIHAYLEKNTFVTASVANINTRRRTIALARAGHMPLYVFRKATNKIEQYIPKGMILGISHIDYFNVNIDEVTEIYSKGDIFLFITDGVVEARNEFNEDFDEGRLLEMLIKNQEFSAEIIRDNLIKSLTEFSNNMEQFDDITLVVVKAT